MSNGTKVFLTGATGFVGSAVARKLAADGFEVRALTRHGSPRAHLDGIRMDFVEGDMRDAESIRRGMAGVRYVFHVAADYRLWARDRSEIVANNVEGTRIIMQEAMRAGVDRVVYTSSVATLGWPHDGAPGTEDIPLSEQQGIGAYKRSKIAAEQASVADKLFPALCSNWVLQREQNTISRRPTRGWLCRSPQFRHCTRWRCEPALGAFVEPA